MLLRTKTHGRLVAKVLRELLQSDAHFTSLADLTDVLKYRCAELHILWTNDTLGEAFRLVGSNMRLPLRYRYIAPPRERFEPNEGLSHTASVEVLEGLPEAKIKRI